MYRLLILQGEAVDELLSNWLFFSLAAAGLVAAAAGVVANHMTQ